MKCQIHDDRNTAGQCSCSEIVTAVRLILGSTERVLVEILDLPVPTDRDGGLGYDLRVRAESALTAIQAMCATASDSDPGPCELSDPGPYELTPFGSCMRCGLPILRSTIRICNVPENRNKHLKCESALGSIRVGEGK